MSEKSRFRGPFEKQHGKRAELLFKSERMHLYHIYWSLWRQLGLKKSLWVTFKILGLFVNPLTANDRYSLLNRGDLLRHFQMQFSQKQKTLSEFFLSFSKFRFIFKHFQKKDEPHSWCIFESTNSQKCG